ncbi:Replication-relaxation [Oceanobacillus limi]|uniref:Replication-relaxation n=1 Tax=Oceanobacillus limi TaxID=930131 RepID=A0A1I0GER3_9BACI|nr:replication-relaxation family protein [Oceanobacillus limi]SET69569.1 Replication-relaxation [Oceanobacillus limi]
MYAQTKFQRRTTEILSSLNKLVFATRSQLQTACNLGGVRNANRILARLESDNLIRSIRWQQKIYGLTKEGRELIGEDNKTPFKRRYVEHTILCNEAYLALDMPTDWETEREASFRGKYGKVRFVSDATFTQGGRRWFVEIDRTQRMTENRKKIETYAELQSVHARAKKRPPYVKFYGIDTARVDRLREMMAEEGVEGTAELIS